MESSLNFAISLWASGVNKGGGGDRAIEGMCVHESETERDERRQYVYVEDTNCV